MKSTFEALPPLKLVFEVWHGFVWSARLCLISSIQESVHEEMDSATFTPKAPAIIKHALAPAPPHPFALGSLPVNTLPRAALQLVQEEYADADDSFRSPPRSPSPKRAKRAPKSKENSPTRKGPFGFLTGDAQALVPLPSSKPPSVVRAKSPKRTTPQPENGHGVRDLEKAPPAPLFGNSKAPNLLQIVSTSAVTTATLDVPDVVEPVPELSMIQEDNEELRSPSPQRELPTVSAPVVPPVSKVDMSTVTNEASIRTLTQGAADSFHTVAPSSPKSPRTPAVVNNVPFFSTTSATSKQIAEQDPAQASAGRKFAPLPASSPRRPTLFGKRPSLLEDVVEPTVTLPVIPVAPPPIAVSVVHTQPRPAPAAPPPPTVARPSQADRVRSSWLTKASAFSGEGGKKSSSAFETLRNKSMGTAIIKSSSKKRGSGAVVGEVDETLEAGASRGGKQAKVDGQEQVAGPSNLNQAISDDVGRPIRNSPSPTDRMPTPPATEASSPAYEYTDFIEPIAPMDESDNATTAIEKLRNITSAALTKSLRRRTEDARRTSVGDVDGAQEDNMDQVADDGSMEVDEASVEQSVSYDGNNSDEDNEDHAINFGELMELISTTPPDSPPAQRAVASFVAEDPAARASISSVTSAHAGAQLHLAHAPPPKAASPIFFPPLDLQSAPKKGDLSLFAGTIFSQPSAPIQYPTIPQPPPKTLPPVFSQPFQFSQPIENRTESQSSVASSMFGGSFFGSQLSRQQSFETQNTAYTTTTAEPQSQNWVKHDDSASTASGDEQEYEPATEAFEFVEDGSDIFVDAFEGQARSSVRLMVIF